MTNVKAAEALGIERRAKTQDETRASSFSAMLATLRPQIAMALPRHMTPDRMTRIVLTEIRKIPKLAQCEQKSLFGAIVQASQLGLEPGSSLGHAYLIPFENRKKGILECQLLIGYRGMIELARRSGQIETIYAQVVRKADKFSVTYGLTPSLEHVPDEESEEATASREQVRGAYAVARLKGGAVQFEWMPVKQIEGIRKRSRSADSGPWVTDYEEMCKKTAVRRLFKYLPVSIELQGYFATVANLDTAVDLGETQGLGEIVDGTAREVADPTPEAPPETVDPFVAEMNAADTEK